MVKYKYPDGTARWANSQRKSAKQLTGSAAVHELVLFSLARVKHHAKRRAYDNERNKKPDVKLSRSRVYSTWRAKPGNKEKRLEDSRKPSNKAKAKERYTSDEYHEKKNAALKHRRDTDPEFLVECRLRSRFYCAFKRRSKIPKDGSVFPMCGMNRKELMVHLTKYMEEGMTIWNTDIDHIFPIKSYDLKNPIERAKIFHYSNLRPCWPKENQEKHWHLPTKELASRVDPSKWPVGVVLG